MIGQNVFLRALKFAAHAAGKQDVRPQLNGVLFELRPDGLTLVATNGHRMAAVSILEPFGCDRVDILVSNDDVKSILSDLQPKTAKGMILVPCEGMLILTDCDGQDRVIQGLEHVFPNWRGVTPSDEPTHEGVVGMLTEQVAESAAACATLAGKSLPVINLEFRGVDRAITLRVLESEYEDAYCLIMPLRRKT